MKMMNMTVELKRKGVPHFQSNNIHKESPQNIPPAFAMRRNENEENREDDCTFLLLRLSELSQERGDVRMGDIG